MRRTWRGVPVALTVLLLTVTGCGGSEPDGAAEPQPTATATTEDTGPGPDETAEPSEPAETTTEAEPEPAGPRVQVRITGDRVTPNGKRIEVGVGEPLTLKIRSDRAAELHVHSSPEQVLEITTGRSTRELVIDKPGVVDVEEHDSGIVLFQVQVS